MPMANKVKDAYYSRMMSLMEVPADVDSLDDCEVATPAEEKPRGKEIQASLFFLTGKIVDGEFVFQSTRSREEHAAIVERMVNSRYRDRFPQKPINEPDTLTDREFHRIKQVVWRIINDSPQMPQKHIV